jgi:hypothetical protein
MSFLNDAPAPINPSPEQIAEELKQDARTTYRRLRNVFTLGAEKFWRNPHATPEALALALGTDGQEVFQLHAKIGELLAQVDPEIVTSVMQNTVGQFVYEEDGSVRVVE